VIFPVTIASFVAHWDVRNEEGGLVASGVYFYAFEAGDFRRTEEMTVLSAL